MCVLAGTLCSQACKLNHFFLLQVNLGFKKTSHLSEQFTYDCCKAALENYLTSSPFNLGREREILQLKMKKGNISLATESNIPLAKGDVCIHSELWPVRVVMAEMD